LSVSLVLLRASDVLETGLGGCTDVDMLDLELGIPILILIWLLIYVLRDEEMRMGYSWCGKVQSPGAEGTYLLLALSNHSVRVTRSD
jgi:hypothetical protein